MFTSAEAPQYNQSKLNSPTFYESLGYSRPGSALLGKVIFLILTITIMQWRDA